MLWCGDGDDGGGGGGGDGSSAARSYRSFCMHTRRCACFMLVYMFVLILLPFTLLQLHRGRSSEEIDDSNRHLIVI